MAYNHFKKFSSNVGKANFLELKSSSEPPVLNTPNVIITSIDPGIVNCGIYTCSYNIEDKTHRSLYLDRLEFNENKDNHYIESINKLEALDKLFSSSHYIVIESQMTVNYNLVRMGQHLVTYFTTKYKEKGNKPIVIEINNQAKTKLLDCPKGLTKYRYKKWCTEEAVRRINDRNNDEVEKHYIYKIKNSGKSDDMSDTVCQHYAFVEIMNDEYNHPTLPVKTY